MRISDWSSDVCSSDLRCRRRGCGRWWCRASPWTVASRGREQGDSVGRDGGECESSWSRLSISNRRARRSVESRQSGGRRRHRHPQRGANMSYVDGFVVPVPRKNLVAYRNLARKAGKIWKEHVALEYVDCVADAVQPGKNTSFQQSGKP